MKKLVFIVLFITITLIPFVSLSASSKGLGDSLFTLDVEQATGDARLMGVEFDGTNYWLTGAYDFTKAYLYEVSPGGTLVNKYEQPPANWGGWGWRDLAFDGTFLYAGDPNAPYIDQIDPTTGMVTGIKYGPYPVVPCRALAYDCSTDSFWTASFSSSIYQCFKDGTYNTYTNPGLTICSAAMEAYDQTDPKLWFCVFDGMGATAVEMDSGGLTGKSFAIGGPFGDNPVGACSYDLGYGNWALVVLHQFSPSYLQGYDLDTLDYSLKIAPNVIKTDQGGTLSFSLNAGTVNADRYYALLASVSGHSPGTPMPDGHVILPLNWDTFTNMVLTVNPPGFVGQLDSNGEKGFLIWLAPFSLPGDITVTFAYPLQGPPWNFASTWREVFFDVP